MKADKLRELAGAEMDLKLRDTTSLVWKTRFQGATGQTEGLGKIRGMKRDIARMKTIQRERELTKDGR
ncbi:MAG: 50S ribosomal protein L29 [Acidobacteria bacterium]|nr:50S ribosomal protein L29 [Acidobacteriota bacterium]